MVEAVLISSCVLLIGVLKGQVNLSKRIKQSAK
jgi:hypothetical protein